MNFHEEVKRSMASIDEAAHDAENHEHHRDTDPIPPLSFKSEKEYETLEIIDPTTVRSGDYPFPTSFTRGESSEVVPGRGTLTMEVRATASSTGGVTDPGFPPVPTRSSTRPPLENSVDASEGVDHSKDSDCNRQENGVVEEEMDVRNDDVRRKGRREKRRNTTIEQDPESIPPAMPLRTTNMEPRPGVFDTGSPPSSPMTDVCTPANSIPVNKMWEQAPLRPSRAREKDLERTPPPFYPPLSFSWESPLRDSEASLEPSPVPQPPHRKAEEGFLHAAPPPFTGELPETLLEPLPLLLYPDHVALTSGTTSTTSSSSTRQRRNKRNRGSASHKKEIPVASSFFSSTSGASFKIPSDEQSAGHSNATPSTAADRLPTNSSDSSSSSGASSSSSEKERMETWKASPISKGKKRTSSHPLDRPLVSSPSKWKPSSSLPHPPSAAADQEHVKKEVAGRRSTKSEKSSKARETENVRKGQKKETERRTAEKQHHSLTPTDLMVAKGAGGGGTGRPPKRQEVEEETPVEQAIRPPRSSSEGRLSPSIRASSSPLSLPQSAVPTGIHAVRNLVFQHERETAALRETNVRQQSMVATLKESLQHVQQQLSKQAEWFTEERTRTEKERETQLGNLMEQLRVVRRSAETLLTEKKELVEENKRQHDRLLEMVQEERREKEHIMQEYRDKTERIIASQGEEITKLRRQLAEVEEALEFFKIQYIAKEETSVKLQESHRALLREKEELKGTLQKLQQRHLQEAQAREEAEAKGRREGYQEMEELVERNRKLTQQLQALEQQLQQQRRGHEVQEEQLLDAHRRERMALEERLRVVMSERGAALASQQQHTAELDHLRQTLETEMKETIRHVKTAAAQALQEEKEASQRAKEEWEVERQQLQTAVAEKDQQLHRHGMTHREIQEEMESLMLACRSSAQEVAREQCYRAMLDTRYQMTHTLLLEQSNFHLQLQRELDQIILVAPLRAAMERMEATGHDREHALHNALLAERHSHEESVTEFEKLLAELRVDRHRAQTMSAQYLKELTVTHREKEQLRVQSEAEVEKLEKRVTELEQALQYREMVHTELQGTMKMLHGRLDNYERENKMLHEEVLEQSQKLQEAHIGLGRKDASINQLRAQLRAFEATTSAAVTGHRKKSSLVIPSWASEVGATDLLRTMRPDSDPSSPREGVEMLSSTGGEEGNLKSGVEAA